MAHKKIGAIKVDWFNMRVEFSPNIKIVSQRSGSITGGSDIEETILKIEVTSDKIQPGKPEYKTYVLETDSIEDDEPFDLEEPWYIQEGSTIKESTPLKAQDTTTSSVSELPETTQKKIQLLQKQADSITNMVQKVDESFKNGQINQEEYLKKKNYLGEKLGSLMGQIEELKGT